MPSSWHATAQRSGDAKTLATELFYEMEKMGYKCWLDVKMTKQDEDAMQNGVEKSECVMAIITGEGDTTEHRYFQRPLCVKELKWAIAAGKPIVPVVTATDKPNIGTYIDEGKSKGIDLSACDFQHVDRSKAKMLNASIETILDVAKNMKKSGTKAKEVAVGQMPRTPSTDKCLVDVAENAGTRAAAVSEEEMAAAEKEQLLAETGLTNALIQEYQEGKRCSFWFIRAAKLRDFSGTTPPQMQELRRNHPDWLEQRKISFADGYAGCYVSNTLVISHCWEDPTQPDGKGVRFAAIKEHLLSNPAIEWVWFDFWSMPQGRYKSKTEDIEFSVMLPNINLLFLFCRVLILLDVSYMSRFWTQFEAFLSFRKVTANGLDSTPEGEQRDTIVCIHNADPEFGPPKLRKMWADKTAEQAYAILEKPDVKVTNQKDKDVQLPKLAKLNEFAKSTVALEAPDVVSEL